MSSGRQDLFAAPADDIHAASSQSEAPAEGAPDESMTASGDAGRTSQQSSRAQGQNLLAVIAQLRDEQKDARERRKKVNKELKHAQKRKRRLQGRARQLSNDDLLAVLMMREEVEAAEHNATMTGRGTSSSSSETASSSVTRSASSSGS